MREEKYQRDAKRYADLAQYDANDLSRLQTKIDQYGAGKKNQGGAAYNLISMGYE